MRSSGERDAALAVFRVEQPIAGVAEQLPDDLAVVFVVFYVKDGSLVHRACSPTRRGTLKKNVDPWPTWLSTQMRPPCISMNFLLMLRPRPVPPNCAGDGRVDLAELGEHILATRLGRNSDPVSLTR